MRWGAVASVGFACLGRWEFKGFGVQALVLLALAAIVFVVRGPFFGHVLFCAVGLTRRSSGPAFCGPLILSVSLRKTRFIQPHVLFTGIYLFKRLFVGFWVSCRASPFGAAPVSNIFCKHCAASVAHCFFTVCARRQFGASRFGFWV